MAGCPLDQAFDIQNIKIKKKKKNKNKDIIYPDELKSANYDKMVENAEDNYSSVKQKLQEIKAFDAEYNGFYPVREQERVIRRPELVERPEPVVGRQVIEQSKVNEDFVRISNEEYKKYKEYQQRIYSDNQIVEGFDRINDNFNDIILFALTGVFFIIFTDYVYKLGKKSY